MHLLKAAAAEIQNGEVLWCEDNVKQRVPTDSLHGIPGFRSGDQRGLLLNQRPDAEMDGVTYRLTSAFNGEKKRSGVICLDRFTALTRKYVDVPELTQTILDKYIKRIVMHHQAGPMVCAVNIGNASNGVPELDTASHMLLYLTP